MSWFQRKAGTDNAPERDPRIDMARQKNQQAESRKPLADGRKRTEQPGIVDSEFCYGGDAGPCA
ncbi:MAG: hypothetical protein Kow0074_07770 [Candidatus Zixiibacteriota bacterium]